MVKRGIRGGQVMRWAALIGMTCMSIFVLSGTLQVPQVIFGFFDPIAWVLLEAWPDFKYLYKSMMVLLLHNLSLKSLCCGHSDSATSQTFSDKHDNQFSKV
jgi:hypothetical protein